MGLFSNPRRDFLFRKTAKLIAANGSDIATFNMVSDHKKPDENLVIFLKDRGPENRYHVVGESHLKEIIQYVDKSLDEIDDVIDYQKNFNNVLKSILLSLARGFSPKFGLSVHSRIGMNDRDFNEFGEMFVASESDYDSLRTHFYIVYTADEFTHLDRMLKSELIESLRGLKEIYESYVT